MGRRVTSGKPGRPRLVEAPASGDLLETGSRLKSWSVPYVSVGEMTLGGLAQDVRSGDMRDPETEADEGNRLYRAME